MSKHNIREHYKLGGSSAERWINCTGSVALSATVPVPPSSPQAEEGTHAHELAEIAVTDFIEHKLNGSDPDARFQKVSAGYDDSMIEAALEYREVIWTKVLQHSITKKAFAVEDELVYDEGLGIGGFVDFWAAYVNDKGELAVPIVDFKYGYHEVAVKNNYQLMLYLLMVWKLLQENGKEPDVGIICIFQPRCSGEAWKEAKVSKKQLLSFEKKVVKAAKEIYVKKSTKLKVGSWCKWCPAQAVCPTYSKQLQEKSSLALIRHEKVELPKPDRLSDEALSKILLHREAIHSFLDACEAYGVTRYLEGVPVPGTKVVESKGRRGWVKDIEMVGAELKKAGVSFPYDKKLKTIAQISKLVPQQVVDSLTIVSEPRKVLVPEEDERPAIQNYIGMLKEK